MARRIPLHDAHFMHALRLISFLVIFVKRINAMVSPRKTLGRDRARVPHSIASVGKVSHEKKKIVVPLRLSYASERSHRGTELRVAGSHALLAVIRG